MKDYLKKYKNGDLIKVFDDYIVLADKEIIINNFEKYIEVKNIPENELNFISPDSEIHDMFPVTICKLYILRANKIIYLEKQVVNFSFDVESKKESEPEKYKFFKLILDNLIYEL